MCFTTKYNDFFLTLMTATFIGSSTIFHVLSVMYSGCCLKYKESFGVIITPEDE